MNRCDWRINKSERVLFDEGEESVIFWEKEVEDDDLLHLLNSLRKKSTNWIDQV